MSTISANVAAIMNEASQPEAQVGDAVRELGQRVDALEAVDAAVDPKLDLITVASASGPASMAFAEDTDNGAHIVTLKAPASVAASCDVTLPGTAQDLGKIAMLGAAGASGPASLALAEDTDNGAHVVTLKAPASVAADCDVTLPGTAQDLGKIAALTAATTTVGAKMDFAEGTDNGVHKVTVKAPDTLGGDVTCDLPSSAMDLEKTVIPAAQFAKPEIVSVGAAHGSAVAVAIRAVDSLGAAKAGARPFTYWLSSSQTTGALHGTAPDGGLALSGGSAAILKELTTSLIGYAVTHTDGTATLTATHAADAQDYYLWVDMGGGCVVSSKLEIT